MRGQHSAHTNTGCHIYVPSGTNRACGSHALYTHFVNSRKEKGIIFPLPQKTYLTACIQQCFEEQWRLWQDHAVKHMHTGSCGMVKRHRHRHHHAMQQPGPTPYMYTCSVHETNLNSTCSSSKHDARSSGGRSISTRMRESTLLAVKATRRLSRWVLLCRALTPALTS